MNRQHYEATAMLRQHRLSLAVGVLFALNAVGIFAAEPKAVDRQQAIAAAVKKLTAAGFELDRNRTNGKWDIVGVHDRANITDAQVAPLADLPDVDSLILKNTSVGDGTLKIIAQLENLRWLELESDQDLTPRAFAGLQRLTHLERIILRGNYPGAAIQHLLAAPKLQQLQFYGANLTDNDLKTLVTLKPLEHLSFYHSDINDARLEIIAQAKGLRSLSITDSPLKGKTLEKLAALPNLAMLTLVDTEITDATLVQVLKCENLTAFFVGECPVTIASVRQIAGLKNLKRLTVHKTAVKYAEMQALEKEFPNLLIYN